MRTFTKGTALSEHGRDAAWHVWINVRHGSGKARARHGHGMLCVNRPLCEQIVGFALEYYQRSCMCTKKSKTNFNKQFEHEMSAKRIAKISGWKAFGWKTNTNNQTRSVLFLLDLPNETSFFTENSTVHSTEYIFIRCRYPSENGSHLEHSLKITSGDALRTESLVVWSVEFLMEWLWRR